MYEPGDMYTRSGKLINVGKFLPEQYTIEEIAHGLTYHANRWMNRGPGYYPVAWHSIQVSRIVSHEHKLAGLLHDGSEAYICDIPKYVKLIMPCYENVEDTIMWSISQRFGFKYPLDPAVKRADAEVLESEYERYIKPNVALNFDLPEVERLFLQEYELIINRR